MKNTPFFKQVQLLLRVLPYVTREACFALKGGTALNLFVRDMPRLSVDIDLVYTLIEHRSSDLQNIWKGLEKIASNLESHHPDVHVFKVSSGSDRRTTKLIVSTDAARIKVEPNEVFRGTVYPCEERSLVKAAEDLFETAVHLRTASFHDLYGGKLCAAFDRQHPRDLFDVKLLLENEGITPEIRRAFVIYLAGHNRPMHEVLSPHFRDLSEAYASEFYGMTANNVTVNELSSVRESALREIRSSLTNAERLFLISLKSGEPDWNLLGLEGVDRLPAVQWKLLNIRRMDENKRSEELGKLKRILNL
jgi:predicted nucleotidyltransferase component of viral defense system